MSRAKRTHKPKSGRRAARKAAARPTRRSRKAISTRAQRTETEARPSARMAAGWSTLRVVWRPAIAMAMLPYRVYRVYRWAEAEQARAASLRDSGAARLGSASSAG
jgi:hypothetical protein